MYRLLALIGEVWCGVVFVVFVLCDIVVVTNKKMCCVFCVLCGLVITSTSSYEYVVFLHVLRAV